MTLKQIRIIKGVTMAEAARGCGITKQRYNIIEKRGLSHSSEEIARKIADFFEIDLFKVVGVDALKFKPRTNEERQSLIDSINGENQL